MQGAGIMLSHSIQQDFSLESSDHGVSIHTAALQYRVPDSTMLADTGNTLAFGVKHLLDFGQKC